MSVEPEAVEPLDDNWRPYAEARHLAHVPVVALEDLVEVERDEQDSFTIIMWDADEDQRPGGVMDLTYLRAAVDALRRNTSVTDLHVSCQCPQPVTEMLVELIRHKQELVRLMFDQSYPDAECLNRVCAAMMETGRVWGVDIYYHNDPAVASHFTHLIRANRLNQLRIFHAEVDDTSFIQLAQAITHNTSLRELEVWGKMSNVGMRAMHHALKNNYTLTSLNFETSTP
jgi:hypothetical protein